MRSGDTNRRGIGLLLVALIGLAALPAVAQAPGPGGRRTSEDWIKKLAGLETAPDLDLAALRQQAAERVKARAEPSPEQAAADRARNCSSCRSFFAEILFDEDAAVVRPDSYRTLGRIADTLTHPHMLGYKFLIVGHTVSAGRRDFNLTLSQRRADVIRDVLVNTFKISPKRLLSSALARSNCWTAPARRRRSTSGSRSRRSEARLRHTLPPSRLPPPRPAKAGTHKPKR